MIHHSRTVRHPAGNRTLETRLCQAVGIATEVSVEYALCKPLPSTACAAGESQAGKHQFVSVRRRRRCAGTGKGTAPLCPCRLIQRTAGTQPAVLVAGKPGMIVGSGEGRRHRIRAGSDVFRVKDAGLMTIAGLHLAHSLDLGISGRIRYCHGLCRGRRPHEGDDQIPRPIAAGKCRGKGTHPVSLGRGTLHQCDPTRITE